MLYSINHVVHYQIFTVIHKIFNILLISLHGFLSPIPRVAEGGVGLQIWRLAVRIY
jgi:hypothetical protein